MDAALTTAQPLLLGPCCSGSVFSGTGEGLLPASGAESVKPIDGAHSPNLTVAESRSGDADSGTAPSACSPVGQGELYRVGFEGGVVAGATSEAREAVRAMLTVRCQEIARCKRVASRRKISARSSRFSCSTPAI